LSERDILLQGLAGNDDELRHRLRGVPDAAHEERDGARRYADEGIAPVDPGEGPLGGPDELDPGIGDGRPIGGVEDPAHDAAGGRRLCSDGVDQQEERSDREQDTAHGRLVERFGASGAGDAL